ncbi:cyclin B-like guanine nucleotide binding protein [Encephalitozoon intestinalis ATCC 50506]|uniref:Cyclin B-like guanine nucleotide binding protein n=1 Tax=Encephalitozoon intestinalis (strain ATCC 50506) TaxID=876142 RepID=E0S6U9_ENCIT|nr:cyclin B-like guanine nucleotide binding protein [Encephalitozoon intestinalis ATCC 50506]ADM11434.1 cyclin B-like guanine nucleotide binding protein [Encephalitozoon intestinalis ATCC 50506]UTX45130.1 hypothetical protein GPK93_04g06700 [Encephalitozoon intestinalis]
MNLITGYFKHTRKVQAVEYGEISEVYISSLLEHNGPEEYLVSDGNGRIPVFKCIRNADKAEFDGYLKYKLGKKSRRFRLAEGQEGEVSILIDGKYSYILMEESSVPTKYLIFSEGSLKEREIIFSPSTEDIEEEIGKCDSKAQNQVVLCFLKSVKVQYHSQFLYFYVSNVETIYGQVLVSWIDGTMVFHTLTSLLFLNFNELFSSFSLLSTVYGIPYLPHTNFTISYKWQKIYESNLYEFSWNYPSKFLMEVITLILLEERIVFCSRKDSSLRVLQIIELIRPFRWPHIVCLPLLPGMEEILESPLPFITCLNKKPNTEDLVIIDLDGLRVYRPRKCALLPNKKTKVGAPKDHQKEIRDSIELIATEILLWREYLIKKWGSKVITRIPNNPLEFIGKVHGFYADFFRTRMFLAFITEERDYLCRYLIEIGDDYSVILLPYAQLDGSMYTKALRLWIELFEGDIEPVIEHLIRDELLSDVADMVFRRLSYREDYRKIDMVLSHILSPTHEMYMNINIVSKMSKVVFKDLYSYDVYHLRACDCRTLDLGRLRCREDSAWRKEEKAMENARRKVRELIGGMKQDLFDPLKERCECKSKKSVVLVSGPGYVFLCFLLVPENISLMLKYYGSENLFEKNPQVYWSIVMYFLYFSLPLGGHSRLDKEIDVIIDEPVLPLRIDGKPRLYLDF